MGFVEVQRRIQTETYGLDPYDVRGAERAALLRDMVLAAHVELDEILAGFSWKPWHWGRPEYGSRHESKLEVADEIGDLLCFVGNIAAVAHLTTEEVMEGFRRKSELNQVRHRDGAAELALF